MKGKSGLGPITMYPTITHKVPIVNAIHGEIHLSNNQPHKGENAA